MTDSLGKAVQHRLGIGVRVGMSVTVGMTAILLGMNVHMLIDSPILPDMNMLLAMLLFLLNVKVLPGMSLLPPRKDVYKRQPYMFIFKILIPSLLPYLCNTVCHLLP